MLHVSGYEPLVRHPPGHPVCDLCAGSGLPHAAHHGAGRGDGAAGTVAHLCYQPPGTLPVLCQTDGRGREPGTCLKYLRVPSEIVVWIYGTFDDNF